MKIMKSKLKKGSEIGVKERANDFWALDFPRYWNTLIDYLHDLRVSQLFFYCKLCDCVQLLTENNWILMAPRDDDRPIIMSPLLVHLSRLPECHSSLCPCKALFLSGQSPVTSPRAPKYFSRVGIEYSIQIMHSIDDTFHYLMLPFYDILKRFYNFFS